MNDAKAQFELYSDENNRPADYTAELEEEYAVAYYDLQDEAK